jgi:hypothetical protein
MRQLAGLFLCFGLAACANSNVEAKRTAAANADIKPMQSLLVFVESVSADSATEVEAVVVKALRDNGVAVQPGSAHIAYDAPVNQIFDKAEALAVDGTLVVAVESTGVEVDRNPMPGYVNGVAVYRPKTSSTRVGQYSARLYDMRVKGKHPRVWQAKANSRAGAFVDTNEMTAQAARQFVSELEGDDLIARAEP